MRNRQIGGPATAHRPPRPTRTATAPALSALALCTLLALAGAPSPALAQAAQAEASRKLDLPAAPLGQSLNELARQSHLQIIYTPELIAGHNAPALAGHYSARAALDALLKGSGLAVDFVDADTAVLRKAPVPKPAPKPAAPPKPEAQAPEATLDAIRVIAGYEPIQKKKDSALVVESIHYDDVENAAIEESIASMLVQLPGISSDEDQGEPKYVVMRGISPDLNHTTVDGISIATVGEYGSATRRVNLQLIPNDFSTRTDLTKTFTAEQDAGAIGGITDIVTRSAYDRAGRYFVADVFGIYSTYDGNDGRNSPEGVKSHWGKGFKSTFSDRFGADDQFGMVLSARYQSRIANAGTVLQNSKHYFDDAGTSLGAPDRERGWNGLAVPAIYDYRSYTDEIVSYGGSAKFEWKPADSDVYGSALLYSYRRGQSRNQNKFSITTKTSVQDLDADGGASPINQMTSSYQFDTYDRNNRGVLLRLDRKWDASALSLRAGYTQEWYETDEPTVAARYSPSGAYLDFDASGGFPYSMQLRNPSLLDPSRYAFVSAADTHAYARQDVKNTRMDYAFNVEPGSHGFGFASGVEWRRSVLSKDVEGISYTGKPAMGDYLFDPGYVQDGASHSFPWIDYPAFRDEVVPGLTATRSAASRTADYKYAEDLLDGYVSLHYATDRTHFILGVRYDDICYDAFNAATRTLNGVITQEPVHNDGGYRHLLPSFNVLHRLGEDLNLRFSYSQTLGRPMPGDIAKAESVDCSGGDDGLDACKVTRGNPDLDPRRSRNLDVAVEKYFNHDRGLVSLGYFDKKIRDDIFDLTWTEQVDGVATTVTQAMNTDESSVRGLEMVLMNRGMKVGGGQSLDASFNATYMDGAMRYVATDGSVRSLDRMVSQPRWIANAGLTWRIPQLKGAVRLWANYRGEFLTAVGASPWLDTGRDDRTTVNLSMWHRVGRTLTLKYEFNNLFNDQPVALVGENLAFRAAESRFGRSAMVHLIWTP